MKAERVAVVMGGPSAEREVSLRTGAAIAEALSARGYDVVTIDLAPKRFFDQIKESGATVVFNAVHGLYGEDGAMQGALDMLGIPYTGSGVLASALAMDKVMTKRLFQATGINTPSCLFFAPGQARREQAASVLAHFSLPVVVKASCQGSSIGVVIVEREAELADALNECFALSKEVLVEEFIDGREITAAVIGGDGEAEVLPLIEIAPHSGRYDYASKYTSGATDYLVPAPLSEGASEHIAELAKKAYCMAGCAGVARVDFMLRRSDDTALALEINTIPGMTATSLVPKAAAAAGIDFPSLCEKLLLAALAQTHDKA